MTRLEIDYDLPETWQGKMEALAAGVVDYDDIQDLAMQCAELANQAQAGEAWIEGMPKMLQLLLEAAGDTEHTAYKDAAPWIIRCGQAADLVEGGDPHTVNA